MCLIYYLRGNHSTDLNLFPDILFLSPKNFNFLWSDYNSFFDLSIKEIKFRWFGEYSSHLWIDHTALKISKLRLRTINTPKNTQNVYWLISWRINNWRCFFMHSKHCNRNTLEDCVFLKQNTIVGNADIFEVQKSFSCPGIISLTSFGCRLISVPSLCIFMLTTSSKQRSVTTIVVSKLSFLWLLRFTQLAFLNDASHYWIRMKSTKWYGLVLSTHACSWLHLDGWKKWRNGIILDLKKKLVPF